MTEQISLLVFHDLRFASQGEIDRYMINKTGIAERARLKWKQVFQKTLDDLALTLDKAFKKAEPRLEDPWETVCLAKLGLPDTKTRALLLEREIDGKNYEITVTESRSEGEVDRMDIRIRFPEKDEAPPYEWEVYTLCMKPYAREPVWKHVEGQQYSRLEDTSLNVPLAPYLHLQVSGTPAKRLKQIAVGSPIPSGDQVFGNAQEAMRVFLEGVRQVKEALENPNTIIKAFEPHQPGDEKDISYIPLV